MWIIYILLAGFIIFLTVMGIAFRKAPADPFEKEEEERFLSQEESQVNIITDDEEQDEELDETQEDQD